MRRLTLNAVLLYALLSGSTYIIVNLVAAGFQNRWYYGLLIFGIHLVSLLIFGLWVDHYVKIVQYLNTMVKGFSRRNLIPTTFINTDGELGQLNESLHLMAKNLNKYLLMTLQEKDQMETILASMVEGVLAFDTAGRLMLMNKTAQNMLDINWEKVRKKYFLEILRNHQLADLLKVVLTEHKRQVIEVRLTPLDLEIYRVYITPIKGKDAYSQGAVMVLRNVTKVRHLEQMRTEFVANVSHELRTPMTSIKGYVETLLDGAWEDKEVSLNFLNIINAETDRLNRLISDLLYLSRLETGRMEATKKSIKAESFSQNIVNILKPLAQRKNIRIETKIIPGQVISANESMLEQVVINLLENAIKYSHDGQSVRLEIGPYEQGTFIKVMDWGIGIPPESLPRLFERFYRVDKARSRQVGGTGLGLSIVKHIIERHRGQVQVESEEEKGTTFTVILPNV